MRSPAAVCARGASGETSRASWLQSAVFALDRRIRDRLQLAYADEPLILADGTTISAGSRILALHLWNERIPLIGRSGPTLAWARKTDRAIHASLRELAHYLAAQPSLKDIAAICADMPVTGTGQAEQVARVMARYGFEVAAGNADHRSVFHRLGDAVFVLMLVLATNPRAVRSAVLRRSNMRVFVSRAIIERRYAPATHAAGHA